MNAYRNFPKYKQRVLILHLEIRFTGENRSAYTETGEVYFHCEGTECFKGDEFRYEAVTPLKFKFASNLSTGDPTWENKDLRTDDRRHLSCT